MTDKKLDDEGLLKILVAAFSETTLPSEDVSNVINSLNLPTDMGWAVRYIHIQHEFSHNYGDISELYLTLMESDPKPYERILKVAQQSGVLVEKYHAELRLVEDGAFLNQAFKTYSKQVWPKLQQLLEDNTPD